mgnify:CR=1 FL=1
MNNKIFIYFKNLNGLRFIAAFMVLVCHIELNKKYFNLSNCRETTRYLGDLGVDLFFVLSGFLITFLLLKEKEIFNKINFKNFYFRRILRIWPLYYFVVILSLFVLPKFEIFHVNGAFFKFQSYFEVIKIILLFVLILPNVLYIIKPINFSSQTWSIGVEEQFYLIWPVLISKIKKYKAVFIFIILFYWIFYFFLNLEMLNRLPYFNFFKKIYILFRLDVLSIGALGAVLHHEKNKFCNLINSNLIFIFCVIAVIFFYFYIPHNVKILRIVYAILFLIILLNLISNKYLENLFEGNLLNHFGKISYGIYMYHKISIVLVINLTIRFFGSIGVVENFLIYFFSIIITLIISHFSYVYFELPLLKIKERYSSFINKKT